MDLIGSICVAYPWLMDQRHKKYFGVGKDLEKSNLSALAELGREMQTHGFSQFIGVDKTQRRLVTVGIGLIVLAFFIRTLGVVFN